MILVDFGRFWSILTGCAAPVETGVAGFYPKAAFYTLLLAPRRFEAIFSERQEVVVDSIKLNHFVVQLNRVHNTFPNGSFWCA